jgi:hypothetical protein
MTGGNESFAFPPARQKEGAKTGHDALVPWSARVDFSRNSSRRFRMLGMTVHFLDIRDTS